VLEVADARARAGNQYFADTDQSAADLAKEFVFSAHFATALFGEMAVRFHLLSVHGFLVELQYLRGVMVYGNDGVEQGHGVGPGEVR
jgi:hypothetical protein